MLLSWLLLLLVCACSGRPTPSPRTSSVVQPGEEPAPISQWPPALPKVMSALPDEQEMLEEPVVGEDSSWLQIVSQQTPGSHQAHQVQGYQTYFTLPGQLHSHQGYQHSHHGHQHRHRHGNPGGIQYDSIRQGVRPQEIANQEVLLGLESGTALAESEGAQQGSGHRVYQRHIGYQTLNQFQRNPSLKRASQDDVWYNKAQQNTKVYKKTLQDLNSYTDGTNKVFQQNYQGQQGSQRYYGGYQPNYVNMRRYNQAGTQRLNRYYLPYQAQANYNYNNNYMSHANSLFPQQPLSSQDTPVITQAAPVEPNESLEEEAEESENKDNIDLWSRGTSWISSLWPQDYQEQGGESHLQEE